ncbi:MULTISPECIES: panthothenate synthetase [Ralstonia]|uniref:panthothenate synthetase n=1 Tax=Ralstonia TaxID=48736 RepID=UPI0021B2B2DB|nr:panthothenate synthetase [Ralstonia wenshanensis]MCT7308227.1 panthothenate synthetase [Ralstonia wenshanensis]
MRMLVNVRIPHEPFNTYVRDGSIAELIPRVMAESKPEAVYFTEQNGHRGAVLIVNAESASHIPALAEPWFLLFNADCEFRIVMSAEDLQQAGLAEIGAKWK